MRTKGTILGSAVVLYFILAFEVLIMISPFAGLFYAVFNPVLLRFASHPATRWLSAFFLPHMVLPGNGFLVFLRILGSILFTLGLLMFFICALQVYTSKLLKRGAVIGGLYTWIRHPQYLGLGFAGLGLSILWPRFLTAVLWLVMAVIYYFLAKDEEQRMLNALPGLYRAYRSRTGMFLPPGLERALTPSSQLGQGLIALGLSVMVLCAPFLLRAYTVHHLTLWTGARNVSVLAILPEDGPMMDHRMGEVLALEEVRSRMKEGQHYLVYLLPREYIMQGMIADTGGDWKLFEQHRSLSMIADWVFNPFGHLRGGHQAMHSGTQIPSGTAAGSGVIRRFIFLTIEGTDATTPASLFSIGARRTPTFMVDMDIHNLRVLEVKELAQGSGWGSVPTPMF